MSQPLPALLDRLDQAVGPDGERRTSYAATRPRAEKVAQELPLVHRTAPEPGPGDTETPPDWRLIFSTGTLKARPVPTEHERQAGRENSVYFFLGAGAYPSGQIALLLAPTEALRYVSATFTPYDTGGMARCAPVDWDQARYCTHLALYTGDAAEVQDFAGPYIAAHFRDPGGYINAPQDGSPDFPSFHELTRGDRRRWTIEVQAHEDITISPEKDLLRELLVVGLHKALELPDEYLPRVRVLPDNAAENVIYAAIARSVERGAS